MYYVKFKTPKTTQITFHRQEASAIVATAETKRFLEDTKIKDMSVEKDEFHTNCNQLILEVGRKCNLKCEHCLRGEAENITMPLEVAKLALDQFDYISCLTFTGGEPALYGKEISNIVDYIIDTNIAIGCFYVATNGTILDWQLINALMRLYAYCEEKEFCQLDISNDHFHEADIGYCDINYDIYKALNFTHMRGDIAEVSLISEGRAEENGYGGRTLQKDYPFSYEEYNETIDVEMVYVNACGGILSDCDFSYKTQKEMKPYNVYDIKSGKIAMQDIIKTFNREED